MHPKLANRTISVDEERPPGRWISISQILGHQPNHHLGQQHRSRPISWIDRRTLLLVGLPLSGGTGLIIHIVANRSLPLTILTLAIAGSVPWFILIRSVSPRIRDELKRRVTTGLGCGLLAIVAYDTTRYLLATLWGPSFKPFDIIPIFGRLFVGAHAPIWAIIVAGLTYHISNGLCFAIAYRLAIRRPGPISGIAWGIGLELFMAFLYPTWLRIPALHEFLEVSIAGHIVYGAVLGLSARATDQLRVFS